MLESVSPFRILIIDSHDEDRHACGRALTATAVGGRFAFLQAANTSDALRHCLDEKLRCIVLAHRPPQLDAGEFLARLHAESPGFDTPIVLVGGDSAMGLAQAYDVEAALGDADLSGERLAFAIGKAVETSQLRRDLQRLKAEQQKRDDALHDAEERFSCFMDALAAGAWIRDLDGTYVFANRTLAFAMNRTVDQIVGHKPEGLLPPDMVARRNEQNQRAAKSDKGISIMEALKIEGHPPRHLLLNLFPIRDRKGVTKHVGGIGIDMTGMGNIVAEAPVAIAMFDRDMNYLAVSKRWGKEFGEPKGEYYGRNVHDLPPFMREKWKHIQQQVLAGASLKVEEDLWPQPDGNHQWYRWVAYSWTDHTSQPNGILVSVENVTARKLAEDAQRQIEQRYRVFFDNAAFGAAETALDGRILKVNQCLCDIGGYAAEELIGKMASDFIPPDTRAHFLAERSAYVNEQIDTPNYTMPFCRKDGRVISVRITPTLVRNAEGAPVYSCGIFEDITEYVKSEAALRESEQRYRAFFENAAFGAVEFDLQGQITKVNKRLCEMGGYSVEELIGKRASQLAHQDDHAQFVAGVFSYLNQPSEAYHRPVRFFRQDGSLIWVLIRATLVRDANGSPCYGCGIVEDVTERLAAEASLRESEERYRIFFNNGAFGAVEADLEGRFLRVNKWLCNISGYSAEEFSGRKVLDLVHPDDLRRYLDARAAYLAGKIDSIEGVWRFVRKDGGMVNLRLQTTIFANDKGIPIYSCGIVEDVTEQIRAETALRESELRYRTFFDSAAFGAAELDLDGRFLKVNKCLCEMGGYAPEELIGRKASDFTFSEDHESYLKALAQHFAGNPEGLLRGTRFVRKDGSFRWIRITPSLIRDENGVPQYSCGIVEDITENIRYEAALRESEERLRELSDNLPNSAVYTLTRDNNGSPHLTYLSAGVETLTGIPAEKVMANPAVLLRPVLPEYRNRYFEARAKALKENTDFSVEVPIRRPNGEIAWIRMHSRPSHMKGGTLVWHGVQMDITERKLAEIALARNEARLNAVLDGARDGILSIDSAGAIQSINAAGAAMFGYERGELIGQSIASVCMTTKLAPADTIVGGHSPLGRANGQGVHAEGRRADGTEFPIEVATVETQIDGAPLFVCFVRDLSERRTIEARMELLKAQRLAAMGGMAAALAHELNQPLAAIGAHVETAQRLLRMKARQRPFRIEDVLDSAIEQTIRAGEIISALRQFAARGEPDKTAQSLHALIGEVRDAMRIPTNGAHRNIRLRLEAPRDDVFIDKVQIRQVLFNLVRNADESMQDVQSPRIEIASSLINDKTISIDVSDNGPGVSDEIRDKLFEPLTTTKAKGMGIGLSLSRSIAEIHSGGLTVRSNPSGGATFSLTLPLIEAE